MTCLTCNDTKIITVTESQNPWHPYEDVDKPCPDCVCPDCLDTKRYTRLGNCIPCYTCGPLGKSLKELKTYFELLEAAKTHTPIFKALGPLTP